MSISFEILVYSDTKAEKILNYKYIFMASFTVTIVLVQYTCI